jgi:hypothetical protein
MRRVRQLVAGTFVAAAAIVGGDAALVTADHRFGASGAILKGENEDPGPGDPDGVGAAGVVINVNRGRLCYFVAAAKIGPATAAHIHRGATGEVVVPLQAPTTGFSAACVAVSPALAGEIAHDPGAFYVNVHNEEFPNGAIRGQLR